MFRSLLGFALTISLSGCSLFFSGGDDDWDDEESAADADGGTDDGGSGSGGSDGGSGSGGSGGDGGGSGSGSGGSSDYSSYDGYEAFEYSGGAGSGDRNCDLLWDAVGTSSSLASACSDCEFVFDVDMSYKNSSSDDGTCAELSADGSYTYGYVEDYYGYGPYVMYYSADYGYFSAWTGADFSGGVFSYYYGYEDWDYRNDGTYYTYVWEGEADID